MGAIAVKVLLRLHRNDAPAPAPGDDALHRHPGTMLLRLHPGTMLLRLHPETNLPDPACPVLLRTACT